jgi:hypothetical protein
VQQQQALLQAQVATRGPWGLPTPQQGPATWLGAGAEPGPQGPGHVPRQPQPLPEGAAAGDAPQVPTSFKVAQAAQLQVGLALLAAALGALGGKPRATAQGTRRVPA